MKHTKFTILIAAVLFFVTSASFAQSTSTQGTEFWVSFMSNGHKYHTEGPNGGNWILTQVLVSGKRDCEVTLTNPQTNWTETRQVHANSITTIDIDENIAYIDATSEQVLNKGLQITSTDTVSVFCTNIAHLSFDASYVLPIQSLADDYIIQTYDQSTYSSGPSYQTQNQTSAFLIVATEDNTIVDIKPSVNTMNGRPAGQEYHITMNKGQAYQVRSHKENSSRDLSGTRVTSRDCKRIAVFNGNTLTAIPNNGSSYDHVFEQAMPVQSWGKRFVVTSSLEREKDIVKVISASDNNEIYKNGTLIATINAGQSHSFELTSGEASCFIEASGRAAVYLYNMSRGGNMIGDPSVVWIAPVEQRIDRITFSTFNNQNINIQTHHVNIIVNTEDVGSVFLYEVQIPSSAFSPVAGNSDFSFTRKDIQHGVHHLRCDNGFNAHVYGFGVAKGYAYLVGSKTEDLTVKVELNEAIVQPGDTIEHCIAEPIHLNAQINLLSYELNWNLGDGTTSTQNPVTHEYNEKRFYEVSLIITTEEVGGCVFSTSDTLKFYIDGRQKYDIEEVELCKGDVYSENGFNVVVTNDTILGKAIPSPEHPLCPDSLLVYVTALPGYYASYSDTVCWTDEPFTYTDHGFNLFVDHPDIYEDQIDVPIPGGCDSIIDLRLVVTNRIINPNPIVFSDCTDSFTWNGVTYTEDGDYEQVFTSIMGCDSIIQLHVVLTETVEGGTDTITDICSSYEWHGQHYNQSGFYTDTIKNIHGCDSIVHLDLSMALPPNPTPILPMDPNNTNPHWVITATEFYIYSYEFTLNDSVEGQVWDSVAWVLEDNNNWTIEPFGENGRCCRVSVIDYVSDTVWLTAKVFNDCTLGEGIERRFWLLSSFYGMEDHDQSAPSTGPGAFNVDIVPNPNNGSMNLVFTNMEGKIDAKIYDMTGILIDQFALNLNAESRHPYHLGNYPNGVYLLVFNYKGIMVTKKIVVIE